MQALVDLVVAFIKLFRISFITQPWEKAYRVRFGRWDKVYGKGFHWRIPFGIDLVKEWDLRTLVVDLESGSIRTKDGVSLAVSGKLRYRINDVRLASIKVRNIRKTVKDLAIAGLVTVTNLLEDKQVTIQVLQENVVQALEQATSGWGVKIVKFHPIDLSKHIPLRMMSETKDLPDPEVKDLT
jgi:regulator of protease activity HflC (stomatin/prohibitin superfamily)